MSNELRSDALKQLRQHILEEDAARGYDVTVVRLLMALIASLAAICFLFGVFAMISGDRAVGAMVAASSAVVGIGSLVISEAVSIGAAILKEMRVQRILIARLVNGRPQYPAVEDYLEEISSADRSTPHR